MTSARSFFLSFFCTVCTVASASESDPAVSVPLMSASVRYSAFFSEVWTASRLVPVPSQVTIDIFAPSEAAICSLISLTASPKRVLPPLVRCFMLPLVSIRYTTSVLPVPLRCTNGAISARISSKRITICRYISRLCKNFSQNVLDCSL